ncbi:hypothetical protein GCM10023193_44810 [Planotetraspora kaengkrachanensis]|uniref:Uncharacterized protein n=1 Tax=Planotetraspora kaengkrachanensis TaxID=575193 RepID=A0A8J3V9G7_9ACTN|nr:hypothetical protein Pka01_64770 [Planotetraspora kaengkrachanensis]
MLTARLEDERDERGHSQQHAEQRVGDQRAAPDPRHETGERTRLHGPKYPARAPEKASPVRGIAGRSAFGGACSTDVPADTRPIGADAWTASLS